MNTPDIKAAMAVRDLMSATQSLSELPHEVVRIEANDIELVRSELGRLLSRLEVERAAA